LADDTIDLAVVLEMPELCRAYYTPPYKMHYWPDFRHDARHLATPEARRIRAVQTNGSFGLKRPQMDAMPALEIIAIVGAGFEGVDLAAARERGIVVTYGLGSSPTTGSCSRRTTPASRPTPCTR
jgi:lactate dehydrogenase-like 2-hydroxyacid dehydrogenase